NFSFQPGFLLLADVILEYSNQLIRHVDAADALRFRRHNLPANPIDTPADHQILSIKVDIAGVQSGQLAFAEPSVDRCKEQRVMLAGTLPRLHVRQKQRHFLLRQWLNNLMFGRCLAVELAQSAGWIFRDVLPFPGMVEELAKLLDDSLNCRL